MKLHPAPPAGWIVALLMLALAAALLLGATDARAAAEAATAAVAIDSKWVFIGAALAAGLATLGAGFAVARVGTSAVGALAEKPELFGRLLIFIGLAEGIAIYGLIVAILMLNRLGVMATVVYLGDEVSAAGYRLAGAQVRTPREGEESAALAWARERAPLVLLSAAVAAGIDAAAQRLALSALAPLVLIVPDLIGDTPVPDLAARLRAQLGMEA